MKTTNNPLVDAIRDALADLPIDDLEIKVVGDHVSLHGVAGCYDTKRRASERAHAAAPDATIRNEMRVARHEYADDRTLSAEVMAAMARLGGEALGRVRVEVSEGVVYLYGTARDAEERQALASAVWAGASVSRVENHLMLKGDRAADTEVARALSEYVQRAMNLPRGAITVEYSAGVASLSGSVATATQAQAIEELVRWHDQVSNVVNRLRVAPSIGMHPRAPRVH